MMTRAAALAASPRIPISTVSVAGFDRTQRRPHRRPVAVEIPRDRRSEIAADHAAVAVRQPGAVLCRIRLDRRPSGREGARRRYAVDAKRLGRARRRPPGDADLGQWRRPDLPPHHLGRRQVPVHRQGRSHQQVRQAGHALSLRADFASRPAQDRRLLHPARRHGRRSRRQAAGSHLQENRRRKDRSTSTPPMAGSASPTNIGRRRCCRTRRRI